jgi:hypothetical protein
MAWTRLGLCAVAVLVIPALAQAAAIDVLEGKFAFNWHAEPGRQKCVKVTGALMSDFKSAKYRCDLTLKHDSESPSGNRTCTAARGDQEYLIFDTLAACEDERKGQAAAE